MSGNAECMLIYPKTESIYTRLTYKPITMSYLGKEKGMINKDSIYTTFVGMEKSNLLYFVPHFNLQGR